MCESYCLVTILTLKSQKKLRYKRYGVFPPSQIVLNIVANNNIPFLKDVTFEYEVVASPANVNLPWLANAC